MASPILKLTRPAIAAASQALGRAIDWYVSRGYNATTVTNRLIERGFQANRSVVNQLIQFSASKVLAANQFNRLSPGSRIDANTLPTTAINPGQVRVKYRINIEDGDTEKDVFGGLTVDCNSNLTKSELQDCINRAADNFINYYDYDIKRYTVDIESLSSF